MENLKKIVGENLSELRKSKKLTQFELANKFNYSDKSVSKWENGDTLPDLDTLNELAMFYGVTLDFLTHPIEENKDAFKLKNSKRELANKIIITALVSSVVWIIATIIFVYILLKNNYNYWLVFIWAVPLNNIVLFFANKTAFRSKVLSLVNWSLFIWSIITGVFLQVLISNGLTIWPLFLVGIPLEASIILWFVHKIMK